MTVFQIEANGGNPVDSLQLIKEAHTNKKTGQIQDAMIRSVVDFVETQKEALLSSQPLSDDGDSTVSDDGDSTGASTNMFRLQINEMVEKVIFLLIYLFYNVVY